MSVNAAFHAKCPSELCGENYTDESSRRIAERVKDHNGRDHKSHILKHSLKTAYEHVASFDFWIISKNFNGNKRKLKFAESLQLNNYVQHLIYTINQYR